MLRLGSLLQRPAVVLLCVAASAAAAVLPTEAQVVEQVVAAPVVTPAPTPPPTPTPVPVFRPEAVAIPKLGVEAPIIPVGTEADGAMGTPSNARDVAWWEGMEVGRGNALLAAHRDWNGAQGSFWGLKSLVPGDEVRVWGQGQELTFKVAWVEQVDADIPAGDILGEQGAPVLTLITCGGVFDRRVRHYQDRVIARAVLV